MFNIKETLQKNNYYGKLSLRYLLGKQYVNIITQ